MLSVPVFCPVPIGELAISDCPLTATPRHRRRNHPRLAPVSHPGADKLMHKRLPLSAILEKMPQEGALLMFPIITTMDELLIYTGRIDYYRKDGMENFPFPGEAPGRQEQAEETE
jgi:hypothetical protein